MRQTKKDSKPTKEKAGQNISPPSLSSISSATTFKKQQEGTSQQEKRIKTIEYRNGIYQGMVYPNQERTSLGLFTWDSGEVYFGEWKNDMLDGEGILFFPQGGFIHGFYMKGKLNGAAFFKFSNGDIYEGFWKNGKLEGNCYKYFSDDDRWILSDYKNGEFKRIISKGDGQPPSYVFNYITSTSQIAAKHQQDTFLIDGLKIEAISFNDGGQYLGLVKNSMPTSLGIFKYSDGKFDVGFYKDGNLDGLGRLNLHNGDVFDGFLQKGLFHGVGCFFQKESCSWIYGDFENNKCINILKKGQGNFPIELIEHYRIDHHKRADNFIDQMTLLDVYFPPLYNSVPIGPEKHNFYLDLSITNPENESHTAVGGKQTSTEPFNMNKVLPKDLTANNYQSPPPSAKGKGSQVIAKKSATQTVIGSITKIDKTPNLERGISNKSKGSVKDKQPEKKVRMDKKSLTTIIKEPLKKPSFVSPPPRLGKSASGVNSQTASNQSSARKSTLKKTQPIIQNKQQKALQTSVSKIQNEKQEIDQQSIHDYDNMVKLIGSNPEQQGQNINFDEVFYTESSQRSSNPRGRDLQAQKSLAQFDNEEFDLPKQIGFHKSKSMATYNTKKTNQPQPSHKQSTNLNEIGNVSKISGICDTSGYKDSGKGKVSSNFGGVLKPNIFGKKSDNSPFQFKSSLNQDKIHNNLISKNSNQSSDSDSNNSFSSISSDKAVRIQPAVLDSGRDQFAIIKEEERLRSYSGTPVNQNKDEQKQKPQYKFQSERKQSEENKLFLEAERLSRQVDRDSPISAETHNILIKDFINIDDQQTQQLKVNRVEQTKQSGKTPMNQERIGGLQSTTPKVIQVANKRLSTTKNNQNLEFEKIRNEISNYEQMAQQTIPERLSKSKQRKDMSRDPSSNSKSPQSNTKQLLNISPNFQNSPFVNNVQKQEDEDEYLDLADSEQVLDSIKQIKQNYIHQIHDLENKQKQVTTPLASNFKYNVVASFNVPNDEQNILKDDSFNQDISPQNPIENYDSPYRKDGIAQDRLSSQGRNRSSNRSNSRNQKQYTEEELNQITEKIERNLISYGSDSKNKRSSNEDYINEESMQFGDYNKNREERVVRSKLENEPDFKEIQQKQMQQSLEQAARINQMLDGSQYRRGSENSNSKMFQAQQSMRSHSGQKSPYQQSPLNNKDRIITQSNVSFPTGEVITGQVVQVVKEILPATQQTTVLQKKLSDNAIQSTVTTKTVQPIVTTRIVSPIRSRPSSQTNSPLIKQQAIQQPIFVGQQTLLPQQVVGHIQTLVGAGGQQNQNRVFSEQTQNKIAQAVNQQWKQKYPEFFSRITPMEFYQSIIQRQNHLKDLTPQELEQLEADIQILKKMNIAEDLQQIIEQNMSNVASPLNRSYKDDGKHQNEGNNSEYWGRSFSQRKQDEELTQSATRSALEAAAAAEKARKEYEIQQQYFQSHLSQSQYHSLMTQQQQKEIDELKRQQEEFMKQQIIIQKQQSEYLEKLQKQQALIIQQGEEQRKRHEEEKLRQLKEIETIEKQKNLRIQEEEERLRQLRQMQEKVRKQIEDDLQRKKIEDEEHSRRSQALFDKEQQILGRLDNEQLKLSKLQQDYTKLEAQEKENKKVRELQLLLEEENRQKEMLKLEELKREAAYLREQQQSNQYKSDEELNRMHQLQLKYADEQRKQQELLDKLNSQKQMQENIIREQDIVKSQELLNQQKKIQEQQFALQQEQLRIQREREELEVLKKKKNDDSFLEGDQRQNYLKKVDIFNKEIDSKKTNISPRQQSLDLGSQPSVATYLNNTYKVQSTNVSPHSNRTDINKMMQESQQTFKTTLPQNDFISIEQNEQAETVKRSHNKSNLFPNNQISQQDFQTQQKNVGIFNQIDKLLLSANQSRNTSPINSRQCIKNDNEDFSRSNRFGISSQEPSQAYIESIKQQYLPSNSTLGGQNTYQPTTLSQGNLLSNNLKNSTLNNIKQSITASSTTPKNTLLQTNSYLPITQILPSNQQNGILTSQISNIEERMKQINQQMQPFSINQPINTRDSLTHLSGVGQYNQSLPTANFDVLSSQNSIKKDPIYQTTSQFSGYNQVQPISSLNNPVVLNTSYGIPSFSGIPLLNNTPQLNQVITNSGNSNSLLASFGNEKNVQGQNILKSSISEQGLNSRSPYINYTPLLLNNQITSQQSNILNPASNLTHSPRTQELNQYRVLTTPTTNILPSSRTIGMVTGNSFAQIAKETGHPVIRNNQSNYSKDSSLFLQNNSFTQTNPKIPSTFANNILNSSTIEDQPKQIRNFSEQPRGSIYSQSGAALGGILKNTGSLHKLSQFNSPISNKYVSITPSQNSIHNLNCLSPGNDTNGVSLYKKTNVRVVQSPDTKGAVSLVQAIQDTYSYTEPMNEDSIHINTSFNNNNKSILDSQISQYMHQQTANSRDFSPVRKQIIIKKSDRLNMIPISSSQKYYGGNQSIQEDFANEGSDQVSKKQGENRDERIKNVQTMVGNNKIDTVIDEQQENKCNIY